MTDLSQAPGFRRRIEIHPFPGYITAGLEDDCHRFGLRIEHADCVITALDGRSERYPWSTCSHAGEFLAQQAVGRRLETFQDLDIYSHCTHLFDLVLLCAPRVSNTAPTRFDIWVADRIDERTRARIAENGRIVFECALDGTVIEAPHEWAGYDLRKLSTWKKTLPSALAERAMILRRAVHVSTARAMPEVLAPRASDRGERLGACFTYTMPRAEQAFPERGSRRDFSASDEELLQNFDPRPR